MYALGNFVSKDFKKRKKVVNLQPTKTRFVAQVLKNLSYIKKGFISIMIDGAPGMLG